MYNLPDSLKVPAAVAAFRARVAVQQAHQELTFKSILVARPKYENAAKVIALWPADAFSVVYDREDLKEAVWEMAAYQSLYEDLSATLILIAAASVERLHKAVGVSLLRRGVDSYADGISFVQAIQSLANQYKHFGEWLENGPRNQGDMANVTKLVDDPLRTDAAAEFLKRTGFTVYEQFEAALLSCSYGIADISLIPDGRGGMPTVTVSPATTTSRAAESREQ